MCGCVQRFGLLVIHKCRSLVGDLFCRNEVEDFFIKDDETFRTTTTLLLTLSNVKIMCVSCPLCFSESNKL